MKRTLQRGTLGPTLICFRVCVLTKSVGGPRALARLEATDLVLGRHLDPVARGS